jgi:hypothetical protein
MILKRYFSFYRRGLTLWAILGILPDAGCTRTQSTPCAGPNCAYVQPTDKSKTGTTHNDGVLTVNHEKGNVLVVNAPDWLASGGSSLSYPNDTFLTGVAAAKGDDALKRAMTDAASDLANRVSVRIESELTDVSSEKNGKANYHLAAMTRLTSDVRIQGLKYEVSYRGTDVYALAYVSRAEAATERRLQLERALLELRGCMNSARDQRAIGGARAAEGYFQCLRYVTEGLQHDAVVRTVDPKQRGIIRPQQELVQSLLEIRKETSQVTSRPATSLKEAADFLALQFGARGSLPYTFHDAPSFRYGVTSFASSLGQQIGLLLESALARQKTEEKPSIDSKDAVIRGVYFEEGENIRISATIIEVSSGKLAGGAETVLPKVNLPAGVSVLPKNLQSAMEDQRLLAKGELVDGMLRVEVWADKGRRGVVYSESEEIRIFVRVNAPAYVRLIYVLESGIQVPIDQSYYIDASKVNMAVEYPGRFEVSPPFGIEHIHVTAFTKQPTPLPVTTKLIDGVSYEVVADGLSSIVRHRGIKRIEKDEVAESLLTVTTLPSNKTSQH